MVLCECAKFCGWRAIVGLVGLVSSCHRGYFVGPKYFFLWVFHGSEIFLVAISWVSNFFSWEFQESDFSHPGYFFGLIYFSCS